MENISLSFSIDQNFSCQSNRTEEDIIAEITLRFFLSVLGTTFNTLVCLTFWFHPRLVSHSTLLLWNLSAADLVTSSVAIPLTLRFSFFQLNSKDNICQNTQNIPWHTGAIVATFAASIFNLAAMSLDRCFMIRLPISYKNFASKMKVKLVITQIWMTAIIIFACITTRAFTQSFFSNASFIVLVICYCTIIVCYLFVFLGIKRQQRVTPSNDASSNAHARQQATESELAKTIAIIITVFSVSWTPLGYTMLKHPNFETFASSNSLLHWAASVGMATAVVNPLIYVGRKKEYRKAVRDVIRIPLQN